MATFFSDLKATMLGGESVQATYAASSATIAGASVDLLGADGPVFGYMTIGTCSASTVNIAAKLQESADGSTSWTDITGGGFTSVTESSQNSSVWLTSQYRSKRYVRVAAAVTGTSVTSVPLHVSVLSMKKVSGNSGTITS